MDICGLEKTTLIDYPGKVACTIFLFGCNFRCGFCYNAGSVLNKPDECLSEEKILEFLESKKGKLDAVCITGGEPLLTIEKDFLRKIREMGFLIKIDTNGTSPDKLKEIIDEKLIDYIAIDIKNSKEKYNLTAGVEVDISKIEKSMKIISNFENYEFRTTIVPKLHGKEDMVNIINWFKSLDIFPQKYYLQGFKHKGEFIDEKYSKYHNTNLKYLYELKKIVKPFAQKVGLRY